MRKEKGITLISLVIYIMGIIVIMSVVGTLMSFYNNNVIKLNDTSDVNMELSKFTAKMIEETKEAGNAITEIAGTTIKFNNGNIYTYQDNKIYENSIVVSQYVKEFLPELETDGNKQMLRIYIVLEKGNTKIEKNLSYVIEDTKGQVAIIGPTYSLKLETGVYGNLYKISDTEYHLIFNTTGNIAQGYTESQLVAKGTDIRNGSGVTTSADGKNISDQPWGPYSEDITKVKIEEEIKPNSTANYFTRLTQITEIEGLDNIDTSNVTSMYEMFRGCSNVITLDVGDWDTSNVTTMYNLFVECSNLSSIDVSEWDTGKVENMQGVFGKCNNLESVDVSKWNTSNVTNMESVFLNCYKLKSVDVSKWNTGTVENMTTLFSSCRKLENIDINNWNTSSAIYITGMFRDCSNLIKIDASKWNISNVIQMDKVFYQCSNIESIDISGWNTSNVENMDAMFAGCVKLSKIYAGDNWSTTSLITGSRMFLDCASLSGAISYDTSKLDVTYANYINGYFTRGIAKNCAYFEDFNDNAHTNYTYTYATVELCSNSVLKLKSTTADPRVKITLPESKYFSPKEYRYVHIKYRTTSDTTMSCYMVPNPTDETYNIIQTTIGDGEWHIAVFDLSNNSSVWNLSQITGMRFDPLNSNGATIEIDYIGISSKIE